MMFLDKLAFTDLWKKLVLVSPSLSHLILDFWWNNDLLLLPKSSKKYSLLSLPKKELENAISKPDFAATLTFQKIL